MAGNGMMIPEEGRSMVRQCKTERAARRQQAIQESLLELMGMPYENITITAISEKANVPRRTFYNHFDSKEEVLDTILDGLLMEFRLKAMFDFNRGVPVMEESFIRFFRGWQGESREKLELLLKHGLGTRLIERSRIESQQERIGFPRPESIPEELVEIGTLWGTTGFFTILFYWIENGCKQTPEQMGRYTAWVLSEPLYQNKEKSSL